jgi:hypothetical protein
MSELTRLWREHDSTGLRAEPKLITPLLRCASPENMRAVSVASETTQQNEKWGAARLPIFTLRVTVFRGHAGAAVVVAGAMLANMAIVRGSLARSGARAIAVGLRSSLSRCALHAFGKNSWRQDQHHDTCNVLYRDLQPVIPHGECIESHLTRKG